MSTQALLIGIVVAIVAAAALSLMMSMATAVIFGAAIGIIATIAMSWELRGRTKH
jgi:hypothetical protein